MLAAATAGAVSDTPIHFHDLRGELPVSAEHPYKKRPIEWVQGLYLHHSATKGQTIRSMATFHVETRGWGGLSYHFAVGWDGQVFWCNDPTTLSYHTKNHNSNAISVVLVGDYSKIQLTEEQKRSITSLVDYLVEKYDLKFVKVHRDVVVTQCPGNNAVDFLHTLCFDNR